MAQALLSGIRYLAKRARQMNVESAEYAETVRRLATRHGLTSCMNQTKWQEVCEAFRNWSDPPPRFRVSDLFAPDGYVTPWDREWFYHPRPYVSTLWLEIELAPEAVPLAVAKCKRIGVPVEITGVGLRIWGWTGGECRPHFA